MDLSKSGRLIKKLRADKGITQKQVADILGVEPKTVSKWETGRGFPDVSVLTELADIFGVSEKTILSGEKAQNIKECGNTKKTKFYVCPRCGSFMLGTGEAEITCCGDKLLPKKIKKADAEHNIKITEIENNFYAEFNHEMTKEHYISFFSYITFDRVLTVRLYPEGAGAVEFPKMYGGRILYCCSKHGLFEFSDF